MTEMNTDIFLTAQKEVDRLVEEISQMGTISQQQEKARQSLNETGKMLYGLGTNLSELTKKIGHLSDTISQLDATTLVGNLKTIQTQIQENGTELKKFQIAVEEKISATNDSLRDSMINAQNTTVRSVSSAIMKSSELFGELQKEQDLARKRIKTLTILSGSSIFLVILVLVFQFII